MNIKAKLFEKLLSIIRFKNIVSKMMLNPKRREKNELPPRYFLKKHDIQIVNINHLKCISIKSTEKPEKHILYFHGGSYTLQAKRMHWRIVDLILKEIECMLTFINYPLVPESTCTDTINTVTDAYSILCKDDAQEITLMGDSAGGGMSLALAQNIKAKNIKPIPSKIVLLSPWLDISMGNDISEVQAERDLILDKDILKIIGKRYAGKLDSKDSFCSPLFGDLADLGEIALFTGTNEILYAQALMLKDKLLSNKGRIMYYEYENMQHNWISFPIPEAKDALKKACAFIR